MAAGSVITFPLPSIGSKYLPGRILTTHFFSLLGPTREVWAGVGGSANLPCNITSPLPADPALLVLWYKNGIHKPIYSFDVRRGPAFHWKNPSHLGQRATFHPTTASLTLQRVEAEDQGTYRCRVDFRVNPTLTFTTNLSVIVPPRRVAVYTELGVEARSIVGPFTEGDTLRLTCRATGGSPPPALTWWEGPLLLDMTSDVEAPNQVTNTLVVPKLTRRDLHRTLTCQATNSNLTAPLTTTVTLDMIFAPLWVRLLTSRDPVSAGRQYVVVCQAAGSRPPATITWHLANTRLTTHTDKLSHDGNVTSSELMFTPEIGDAGRVLSCLAHSPALSTQPLVDEWLLDVYYVPVASLHPGRSLNLSNIEEGDDVYFECSIRSNPGVYKIVWLHEGQELQHNVSAGVILSNQSLVLQQVTRSASGHYYCVASNIEGDGQSNPIKLRVKYAPVCRNPQMTYHGAARHEEVNIACYLDAHPPPMSFRWTFNNSGESADIPKEHIQPLESGSTVSYTPNNELDYGTLLCWGTNAVGHQRRPCVFHVFPAGKPDPVHNCSMYNLSVEVVHVRCVAGFDGGLPQTFILELYQPHTSTLLANTTNSVPTFSVGGLPPGLAFLGVVYSTNGKGSSEKISLQVYTLKDMAERRTAAVKPLPTHGKSSAQLSMTLIIALVLGTVGGLLLLTIAICAVLRLRYHSRRGRGQSRQGRGLCRRGTVQEVATGGQDDTCNTVCHSKIPPATDTDTIPPPPASSPHSDEKNPDVIPQPEAESWVVDGVNTISSASLPTAYATLPRTQHLCSLANYQPCSAGDVQYAELVLGGTNSSPPHPELHRGPINPQHHDLQRTTLIPRQHNPQKTTSSSQLTDPHGVIYATLDNKTHYSPLAHKSYSQPVVITNTPIQSGLPQALHRTTPTQSEVPQTTHSPWIPSSASMGRRHSLRRDPHEGDPEAALPLIPCQKESSV
ncbi:protein turtle homolog B [Cherax quadricarinatus]